MRLYCLLVVFLTVLECSGLRTFAAGDPGQGGDANRDIVPGNGPQSAVDLAPQPVPNNNTGIMHEFNCTNKNLTACRSLQPDPRNLFDMLGENRAMLMRTFYVLIGVTGIIVVYFVVRTMRLRHRQSKTKKYGVISTSGDNLEMTPLDQDDEDEDLTVFEINSTHPK